MIYHQSVRSILTVPVENRINGESLCIFSFCMFESSYFPNKIIKKWITVVVVVVIIVVVVVGPGAGGSIH